MVWAEPGLSSIHYRCKYVSQEAIQHEVKKSQDEMTHSSVMTDEFKRTKGWPETWQPAAAEAPRLATAAVY